MNWRALSVLLFATLLASALGSQEGRWAAADVATVRFPFPTPIAGHGEARVACDAFEVPTPQQVVDQADAIAAVKAPARYAAAIDPDEPVFWSTGPLEFEVVQVLRGELGQTVVAAGTLVDRDDYNPRTVPYESVRRDGEGPCIARTYRPGAHYLFLMRHDGGSFTPYWAALAPTNEQLDPVFRQDPWFRWVKARVSSDNDPDRRR